MIYMAFLFNYSNLCFIISDFLRIAFFSMVVALHRACWRGKGKRLQQPAHGQRLGRKFPPTP